MGSVPILQPIVDDLEAEFLQDSDDGDLEVKVKVPVTFGGCSEGLSVEDSDATGDLIRAPSVMCDGSGDLCLLPLTVLPLPEEAKEMEGDAIPLVGAGQSSGDLTESSSQVVPFPSSLLPLMEPSLSSVLLPAVGLEETREDVLCLLQGPPVANSAGMIAENSGDLPGVQSMLNGDERVPDSHLGNPMMAREKLGSFMAEDGVAHVQAEGLGLSKTDAVKGTVADSVSGVQVRSSGGGSPEVRTASRFAPLSELDEDSVEDDCGDRGVLDREGHRLASSCVDALFDACEVIGDGPETARGGKMKGRGRGGRRGGSMRGRGGRSRGRGPS
ncbi:hypothetical protein Dimus_013513 [Dionaea muscipula]